MDDRFRDILERGYRREENSQEDSEYLLTFDENSPEADELISVTDRFVRERCANKGYIAAQIGVIVGPCYADCAFCNFASSTTDVEQYSMKSDELSRYLRHIVENGMVSTVSLMTIHNFDFEEFLECVETARKILPEDIEISTNTGDLDLQEAVRLRKAGVSSAYHAIRLGESIDNWLEPRGRLDTIKNLKKAGIRVATGVEPIGPEHSVHEICGNYFRAMEFGADRCSASARESVPGTRLEKAGVISPKRLLQIRSALLICSTWCDNTEFGFYGGFYGGFNRIFAEYAGSPKDIEELSEKGLQRTVDWAKNRLESDGYRLSRLPPSRPLRTCPHPDPQA